MDTLKSASISVEVDDASLLELARVAEAEGISQDDAIRHAIRFYLNHGKGYRAMLKDGTEAWNHYKRTGLHVTDDEIGDWIAELDAGNDDAEPPACHT
ncbi:hypothetical protein Jab_2c19870 [Janthinobacterium sp. HH01]|uniref:ribbon-helix-helix domain-containing protein n=1 Tax=Janthinobacterium sp. HH01 TaxID=1198452 RepID=UPI0002AEDC11|nr:ribbon-helix-helix domain-containing protein [Janthinobacterium sp. HH01]ELX09903.1 hypothetical protein Jab_2c19870 [Janthinobacterium sp. HH01]